MIYSINGKEVSEAQWRKHQKFTPPDYEKGECPRFLADEEYTHLNGGMGMFSPQLARHAGDRSPDAHFKSKRDLVRKGAKRNLSPYEGPRDHGD